MGINAILAISYRDLMKLLRDPVRLVSALIFPLVFIGILGGSLQSNLGADVGYNFLTFTFTGVLAQTLFQSTSSGIISLIEDRENDFSQEIFVSPISRYSIVFGKIIGETLVSMVQGLAIILFGVVIGVPFTLVTALGVLLISIVVCIFGGAFGVLILSNISSQRAANQIFPFIMLPQFFLAGVFNPIQVLPWYLEILSRISPMRYAVDLTRGVFYAGSPESVKAVADPALLNVAVVSAFFVLFMVVGTALFVRRERYR
jgi:ABC-2 type transport system permease protein